MIPGSTRTRVGETTIRDWIRRYREQGFEGLLPKCRRDQAKPRRMPPEVIETMLSIKNEVPELSVRQVIRRARDTAAVPEDVPLPRSTLHRLFVRKGLMVREQAGPAQDLRRYQFPFAGDCWQSDAWHGTAVRDEGGRLRKTYLLATLDDATRVIPYGAFGFSENAAAALAWRTDLPFPREPMKISTSLWLMCFPGIGLSLIRKANTLAPRQRHATRQKIKPVKPPNQQSATGQHHAAS